MKFLDPVTETPPAAARGKMALVLGKLAELEPGQWLPIEFETASRAGSFATAAKKRKLQYVRHSLTIYVQKHSHDWKIGTPDRFGKSKGECACGETKTFDDAPIKYGRGNG